MCAFLLSLALLAMASSDAEVLARAEADFAEGLRQRQQGERGAASFRRSAHAYDELRRRGVHNAALYHNLGNAHLLAGDLPSALLAYRLGLRLAPADKTLQANLEAAREQVVFPNGSALGRPAEDARPRWLQVLDATNLALLAGLTYVLGCVVLTRWGMVRRPWPLTLALVLLTSALLLTLAAWKQAPSTRPLLVLARDDVLLRKGNGDNFPPWHATPLPRGVEAETLFVSGDWVQIQLAGGEIGWVSTREVVRE